MPKGERADKQKERGRKKGATAARLIAVDLHDKRSRQLASEVALRR